MKLNFFLINRIVEATSQKKRQTHMTETGAYSQFQNTVILLERNSQNKYNCCKYLVNLIF